MTPEVANFIGFIGMFLVVAAYIYVTARQKPNPFLLHGANLAGAGLLALSLTVNRNLPALILEAIWAGVAIWGLGKAWLQRSSAS